MQVAWIRLLIQNGHRDDLLALDSSQKTAMESDASSLLGKIGGIIEINNLKSVGEGLTMPSRTGLRELMSRVVQVQSATPDIMELAGIPELEEKKRLALELLTNSLGMMTTELKDVKQSMESYTSQFVAILSAVETWNEDKKTIKLN